MDRTVTDIGEFRLIDRIRRIVQDEGVEGARISIGMGDDTAAFQPRDGYEILVTCDSMVEGRHYRPDWISPFDLGRRAMVMNISDIGAMGGTPLYALISLALKSETSVADVDALYRGFLEELNPMGVCIIGGNVTRSDRDDFMDITLIGEAASGAIKERSGAKPGDAVMVTGYPGQAAAGLEMLLNVASGVDVKDHPLVRHFLKPHHRAREGRTAAATGLVSAMIDISDGLLGDLGHICDRSRVGARLTRTALPVHENLIRASETMGRDVYDFVLGASDDYELIITCPQQNIPEIRTTVEAIASVPVREIGVITAKAGLMTIVEPDGGERDITPKGWNHFA